MEKTLRIIKYLIIGGLFLSLFLPLYISDSLFFPFITGKNFLFRIIIEFIFMLWVILAVCDKKFRPRKSLILLSLFAFIFIMVLSTIFGANPYRSFWSNYERMEGLVTYLHALAYFVVLITVLNTEKLWKWFFHTSLLVSFIIAVYGFLQLAGIKPIHQSDVRLDATLGNASYLAIYMVFHIFLALMYFLKEKNWWKWFYIPFFLSYLIILYNTATRGAILGLVGGFFVFLFLMSIFSKERKKKFISVASLLLILLLITIFWSFRNSSFIKQNSVLSRFSNISMEEQSRFVIWKMSWEGFKENPVLGWGPENYNLVFNKYYQSILYKQEPWFDRAHNVFFDKLVTTGILGLLSYLGLFIFSIFYLFKRKYRENFSVTESALIFSLFAAYFFHNIFVFDNLISFIMFLIFLAYIHFHYISSEPIKIENKKIDYNKSVDSKLAITSPIVITVFVFLFYFINIPGYLANLNLLDALQAAANGKIQDASTKFNKALSHDSFGNSEIREQLASFSKKVIDAPEDVAANNLKLEIFEKALSEMKKQIESSPNDIRYMLFLGSLYNEGKRYGDAIDILEKTIDISPNKQQIYFELGSSYLNKKEYSKAMEILKKSFDLEPSYDEARKIYAMAAIYNRQTDLGEKILIDRYNTHKIPDSRLVNAYASIDDYEKVVQIWEKIVEQNPSNAQYRVSLAAGYLRINERMKAIEQLQKAIEIESKFKQQGEYYINEIKAGRNP